MATLWLPRPAACHRIRNTVVRLSLPLSRLRPHYDALVVGSGYGGGVSAARLAQAGLRVAVLERGREIATGEFPRRLPDLRNDIQLSGKRVRLGPPTGLFDVRLGEDMHVLVGCGLGGGSLINAGVTLRPDRRVWRDEVWPAPVVRDGLLELGYERAVRWLRPARDPHAARRAKFKALYRASAALGTAPVAAPVAVSFEDTVNPAGVAQPACTRCGDCCSGCNVGAKNTVALTYLPAAVRRGAEIFTRVKVCRLAKAADGRWRVELEAHEEARGGKRTLPVTADIVVLAAGTLGSTEILLRSRAQGLALSDRLGQGFSANGDIIAFGYGAKTPVNAIGVGHPSKVEGIEVGACVSGQIEIVDDDLANSLTIQEGSLPSALAPVLPALFLPNGRVLGALQSLVSGVYRGPFAGLQTFFAVSHDSAGGCLALQDDRIVLSWPTLAGEPVYRRVEAALQALVRQVGGSYVKNPLAGTVLGRQPATAHPLGGCGMGRDRGSGVVNHKCQVFDGRADRGSTAVHEGLFVVDGAIMPRSLGANPLLTITAFAERAMLHLARDRGLRHDEQPVPQEAPRRVGVPAALA
jgi:cholesterol oxidase